MKPTKQMTYICGMKRVPEMRSDLKLLKRGCTAVFSLVMMAFFTSVFLWQVTVIRGNSMFPTYHNNEITLTRKVHPNYKRNEVIVLKLNDSKTYVVKRLIGLPGDKIQLEPNRLIVNGKCYRKFPNHDFVPCSQVIILQKNEYWVLGDNYLASKDSRNTEIGIIQRKQLIGTLVNQRDSEATSVY